MLSQPRIRDAWEAKHGRIPTDEDTDAVYEVFVPLNEEVVDQYADLIPGAADLARALRERGLKIGSTTGYTRSIMERVLPLAKAQGFQIVHSRQ